MKRKVSVQAREDLQQIFRDNIDGGAQQNERLEAAIVEWYEAQNTFSDIIKDADGYYCYCPMCERRYAIDRVQFPVPMVRYLRLLVKIGGSARVKDIESITGVPRKFDESSHFPLLRHWGLIESRPDNAYEATLKARRFIHNQEAIPSHLWRFKGEVVNPPLQETNGTPVFLSQMHHKRFNIDETLNAGVSGFFGEL